MKQYDVQCPVCGMVNCHLLLDETNGWMECEKCGTAIGLVKFMPKKRIPVLSLKQD